jgi:hypothetical protein
MHWNLINNKRVFIHLKIVFLGVLYLGSQLCRIAPSLINAGRGQCSRNLKGSCLHSCVETTDHSTVLRPTSLDHVSSRVVTYFVE